MALLEPTLSKEEKYQGPIFSVEQHQIALPNGKTSLRDVIVHSGAVAILAIKDGKILLVKQYRKAIEKAILEIPAGKLDKKGEGRLAAAQRELSEETGYRAKEWTDMITMVMSPGYLTEDITLFLATGLELDQAPLKPDEDEFVEVYWLTREEAKEAVATGDICDAKTLYALLYWDLLEGKDYA